MALRSAARGSSSGAAPEAPPAGAGAPPRATRAWRMALLGAVLAANAAIMFGITLAGASLRARAAAALAPVLAAALAIALFGAEAAEPLQLPPARETPAKLTLKPAMPEGARTAQQRVKAKPEELEKVPEHQPQALEGGVQLPASETMARAPRVKGRRLSAPRARKREWGVLPDKPVRSLSSSSLQVDEVDDAAAAGAAAAPSRPALSLAMPPPPSALSASKRMTRNLSCSSAHEMYMSDIDTPLQLALAQLVKVRAFLAALDPEAIAAAVSELDDGLRDHRSETSSLYSSPTTTTRRGSGLGLGSPYRMRKRLNSPPLLRGDSSASLQSYYGGKDVQGAIGSRRQGLGRSRQSISEVEAVENEQQEQQLRQNGEQAPDEEEHGTARVARAKSEYRESTTTTATTTTTTTTTTSSDGGSSRQSCAGVEEEEEGTEEGDSVAGSREETGDEANCRPGEADDSDSHLEHDSFLPAAIASGAFSPIAALDQTIETLLEPEQLMRPVIKSGSAGPGGEGGGDHVWLNMLGATSALDAANEDAAASAASAAREAASRNSRPRPQRRGRLSSDELSSIVVTTSGKLMVESPSHSQLSDLDSPDGSATPPPPPLVGAPLLRPRSSPGRGLSIETVDKRSFRAPSADELPLGSDDAPTTDDACSDSSCSRGSTPRCRPEEEELKHTEPESEGGPWRARPPALSKPMILRRASSLSTGTADSNSPMHVQQIHLGELNDWNFDTIAFARETGGRALFTLMWAIFSKHDFLGQFRIDRRKFKAFCKELEHGYLPLPYHNSLHAADVLMSMHHLLFCMGMSKVLTPLESMAAMIAAAIHDIKHPGRNNSFLVKSQHPLSILYNDHSVLEQMHLAEGFRMLTKADQDILENLATDEWTRFRRLTIKMVLATDLKDHFETITKLRNLGNRGTDFVTHANRELVLEVAIKIADVGHSAKTFAVHEQWAVRIQEEFLLQGDHERRLGLPVSEFMDRHAIENERNQQSFFEYIALPLFNSVRTAYAPFADIARQARFNHAQWKRRAEAAADEANANANVT